MYVIMLLIPGNTIHVSALKCSMCVLFKDKLQGLRNYNPAFITFKTTSAVTVSEPEPAYLFSLEDWDTFIEDHVNNVFIHSYMHHLSVTT